MRIYKNFKMKIYFETSVEIGQETEPHRTTKSIWVNIIQPPISENGKYIN